MYDSIKDTEFPALYFHLCHPFILRSDSTMKLYSMAFQKIQAKLDAKKSPADHAGLWHSVYSSGLPG